MAFDPNHEAWYILYSPRSLGWFTKSSTFSSDIKEAKVYDRDEALAACRLHKTQGAHNLIPVRSEDLSEI